MLRQRILTALLLLPIILLVILFLPPHPFELFWLAVAAVAAWEWSKMLVVETFLTTLIFIVAVVVVGIGLNSLSPLIGLSLSLVASCWLWLAVVFYQFRGRTLGLHIPAVSLVVGVLILGGFTVACVVLRHYPILRPFWLLYAFLIAWIADSAAYFGGRLWGGATLCSVVSPKKTWSGFFSGLIATLLFAGIVSFCFDFSWKQRVILWLLSLVLVVVSVLGDLGISMLKRIAKVKDSSQLLPGHGGVLDRLDSLLATTIVLAFGLLVFGV